MNPEEATGTVLRDQRSRRGDTLLERLHDDRPLIAVELRPPRSDLSYGDSMDRWIDMHHAMDRLLSRDTVLFLTDNAVGVSEEENLRHLTSNLADDASFSRVVPFLTAKHTLDYCLTYADRAAAHGFEALTVLGGDRSVGPPRCVDHAYQLRQLIRERVPSLRLGGWANPFRDPEEQVGYILDEGFEAEFYLTQIISHHDLSTARAFLDVAERRDVPYPAVFGVFYYRSANPETLHRLGDFFRVPTEGVVRDFEAGLSPEEICARTVRGLQELGASNFYISNLGIRRADERYRRIMDALDG